MVCCAKTEQTTIKSWAECMKLDILAQISISFWWWHSKSAHLIFLFLRSLLFSFFNILMYRTWVALLSWRMQTAKWYQQEAQNRKCPCSLHGHLRICVSCKWSGLTSNCIATAVFSWLMFLSLYGLRCWRDYHRIFYFRPVLKEAQKSIFFVIAVG